MVKHFTKKQKEAKSMAKEEDVKSYTEMTEVKHEVSVKYINGIADGPRNKYTVSYHFINHSRFIGKSDIFV